jgi:hypothetical protein
MQYKPMFVDATNQGVWDYSCDYHAPMTSQLNRVSQDNNISANSLDCGHYTYHLRGFESIPSPKQHSKDTIYHNIPEKVRSRRPMPSAKPFYDRDPYKIYIITTQRDGPDLTAPL